MDIAARARSTARILADREAHRRSANTRRWRRVEERLGEAARRLVAEHGARRVILFGSLAWAEPHPHSDVDVAVEGLGPERFFVARAELERTLEEPVDLITLEGCSATLRERILSEGRLIGHAL
jgi:predicted nucleotidyltransferase